MELSDMGSVAERLWKQQIEIFKCLKLDEYIVMPNHIHMIVIIESSENKDGMPRHAATGLRSLMPNSLSSIVNHYKGAVKKECNKMGHLDFQWQSRFYDHVIRKEKSLDKIREYIFNNPKKWELDRNNPASIWM